MQIPRLMIMVYAIGIHGKKRPMNLVLIGHKYSQKNTNWGLHSVTDLKTCSHCNQKVKKLIKCCVKNYGFSQKLS